MLATVLSRGLSVTADLAGLVRQLASPVMRGLLPLSHAEAALMAAVARHNRLHSQPALLSDQLRIWCDILDMHLARADLRHKLLAARIRRTLKPMIAERRPWRQLMAESHDINGQAGFPMTEQQVEDVVRREVWFALPPGGRHHG